MLQNKPEMRLFEQEATRSEQEVSHFCSVSFWFGLVLVYTVSLLVFFCKIAMFHTSSAVYFSHCAVMLQNKKEISKCEQ